MPQYEPTRALNAVLGFDVLLGLALCFFGYLISQVRVAIGMIVGGAVAANIGYAVSQNIWIALAAGVAGGLVGAVLSSVFYFTGVFLCAALLGGLIGGALSSVATHGDPNPWAVAIPALIAGSAAVLLKSLRLFVTLGATAVGGAGAVVFAVAALLFVKMSFAASQASSEAMPWWMNHGDVVFYGVLLAWVLLAGAGILIQYKLLPDPEKARLEAQRDSAATSWDGDSSKM